MWLTGIESLLKVTLVTSVNKSVCQPNPCKFEGRCDVDGIVDNTFRYKPAFFCECTVVGYRGELCQSEYNSYWNNDYVYYLVCLLCNTITHSARVIEHQRQGFRDQQRTHTCSSSYKCLTHSYMYTREYACTLTHMNIYTYAQTHINIYTYIHTYMFVCVYIHVHIPHFYLYHANKHYK